MRKLADHRSQPQAHSLEVEVRETLSAPKVWSEPRQQLDAALTTRWYILISQLLAEIVEATGDFYRQRGFRPVLVPVTTASISSPMGLGSDSLPVAIDLFDRSTYLADSLQFQLEFLLRHDYHGVYYVMPSFRGEDTDATHLNQFFHSEAELRGGFEDVMELVAGYLSHLAEAILNSPFAEAVEEVAGTVDHVVQLGEMDRLPRIRFAQALERLRDVPGCACKTDDGIEMITRCGELRLIADHGGPVWLTHLPFELVPFYQAVASDGTTLSADLLMGPGEVVGCGERHRTREEVLAALESHRVDPGPYRWYVEMKSRSPMRTAGFGMGLERFLMWLLDHDDIRDLQIFPRFKGAESWI